MSQQQPADALRARILAEAARTPSPTRTERRAFVTRVAAIAAAVSAVPLLATRGIIPGKRPAELIAFSVASATVLAIVLSVGALGSRRSMLGPPRRRLALVSALALPLWVIIVGAGVVLWPAPHEDVTLHSDVLCALLMVVQGGALFAALMVAKRRTDPLHPALTGAALGIVGGAWGFALAYLRCPHESVAHGLVAHVVPTLVLAAVGAVLGRRILSDPG